MDCSFSALPAVLLLLTSYVFDPFTNYNVTEVAIFAISAAGLTVLTGINGQVSLGHGALMMIGAYTTSVLLTRNPDLPLILMLIASIAITGVAGAIVGVAGARLRGPYLAGATLALAVALPQVPSHFASVFGGNQGLSVPAPAPPAFLGRASRPSTGWRGSRSPPPCSRSSCLRTSSAAPPAGGFGWCVTTRSQLALPGWMSRARRCWRS